MQFCQKALIAQTRSFNLMMACRQTEEGRNVIRVLPPSLLPQMYLNLYPFSISRYIDTKLTLCYIMIGQ
jgi:hypothetical protein